ncbi:MAG TPA: hypothetical protein VLK33_22815 [Terriglobales bacterium]|nr:hypothetical protein [Terriglobales bacterium]
MAASNPSVLRRSSRVKMTLPILVTSTEEQPSFSEVCETMMVNAHGCSLRANNKLDAGATVQFQTRDGNWTMAHIVECQPLNHGRTSWMLGAKLDKPTNFWGLENYPEDWAQLVEMPSPNKQPQLVKSAPLADLHAVIAELVEPLHAAVSEIRQKLERKDSPRSSFDISLSYIPPEVEEKIAVRLREELGAQVMDKTRLQAESVLEATKEAVSKRITDARDQFRSELAAELQKVEVRAQGLSDEITAVVQQRFHSVEERLEQQLLEAGIRLEKRGEEVFRVLQNRMGDEHHAYRREMEQVHASVASEVADIHAETSNLATRFNKLDASANHLEKELDERLVRVSSDIISGARTQLESALNVVLRDLGTRNSKELNGQLEDASNRLRIIQKGIETSVSDLVRAKVTDSLVSFGQTIEALAQDAVVRWRDGLARDLSSMTDILERKPQVKSAAAND